MAFGLALAVLLAVKAWAKVGSPGSRLLAGPVAAAGLLAVGWAAGLSRDELGLGGPGGATWYAVAAAGLVAVAYGIGLLIPAARSALLDPRHRRGPRQALFTALVAVPLSTVLVEEVAFRGVLWGLVAHDHGPRWVIAVTAALFGLWHADQHRGRAAFGVVLFTALAGVVFGLLRQAGGSLLGPVVLHWAANGLGVLASAWLWSRQVRALR